MRSMMPAIVFVLALVALVGGCSFFENMIMDGKGCPNYVKLSDFTNDTVSAVSAKIVWPQGEPSCFRLLLAIPISSPTNWPFSRDCPSFSGTVTVRDSSGHEIGQFSISSATSQHCNWLTPHSLDAFVMGWQQTNCMETAMIAGKQYEITVSIPSRPKDFTSLWLAGVQSGEQFRKHPIKEGVR